MINPIIKAHQGLLLNQGSGWNLLTAEYDNINFSISGEFSGGDRPRNVKFNPKGTRMYIVSNTDSTLVQYNLSKNFDISSASFQSSKTISEGSSLASVFVTPDGNTLFTLDGADEVRRYSINNQWDISDITYIDIFGSYNSIESQTSDITFSEDGKTLYILSSAGKIHPITHDTAWDNDNPVIQPLYKFPYYDVVNSRSFTFSTDGSNVYISDTTFSIFQYHLQTQWDIIMSSDSEFDLITKPPVDLEIYIPSGLFTTPDGATMFVSNGGSSGLKNVVQQWDLSTLIEDSTYVGNWRPKCAGNIIGVPEAFTWSRDGMHMYVANNNEEIYQFNVRSGESPFTMIWEYDDILEQVICSGTTVPYIDSVAQSVEGIKISHDGKKVYLASRYGTDRLHQFTLSSDFNISTMSSAPEYSLVLDKPATIFFAPNGFDAYVLNNGADGRCRQYRAVTQWSMIGMVYTRKNLYVKDSMGSNVIDMSISDDGKTIYFINNTPDLIYQYHMDVPWDISTAEHGNVEFETSSEGITEICGVGFNNNGTKMMVMDEGGFTVDQYSLSGYK